MKWIPNQSHGFTSTEMVVAVAIFSIIALAFQVFLQQSQMLTSEVYTKQEASSVKLRGLNWIMKDIRSASRTSLGSLVLNGGFEDEENDNTPKYWANTVGGTGQRQYYKGELANDSRSGLKSIGLLSDTTLVTYEMENYMTFTDGMTYMISGWVLGLPPLSDARIELIDDGPNILISTQISNAQWQHLSFRYPADGSPYVKDAIHDDLAKIRISANTNTGWILFDDISCTPFNSVLISSTSTGVNVSSLPVSFTDPMEATGFRFTRTEGETTFLYRYRIGFDHYGNFIIREKFDPLSSNWIDSGPSRIFHHLNSLAFVYDPNNQIPSKGKDSPLTMNFGIEDPLKKNKGKWEKTSIHFFPLTP